MKELEEYIHLSKYSKFIDKLGRRETWDETVQRYIDFWKNRYNDDIKVDWNEIQSAILNKEVVPSMRALMTAGKALERCNTVSYNCAGIAVNNPRVFDEHFYLLMGGSGVGFSVERQYINEMPLISDEMHDTDTTIIVRDSRAGWAKALKELVALLYNGDVPKFDASKVRKEGERLKTMGGRASGPKPLLALFEYTIRLFKSAKGRKLNSAECHKLMCKIAETVIVGSVRRCMPSGSLVHAKNGMIPIEKISIGDEVLTYDGYSIVTNKFNQGVQEVITVNTQDSSFKCTPNHKIAVFKKSNEYIWRMAKDLCKDDRIIAPSSSINGVNVSLPIYKYIKPNKHSTTCLDINIPKLDKNISWLLGLIHGDGCINEKSGEVSIACDRHKPLIIKKANNQLKKFGVNVNTSEFKNYIVIRVCSKQLTEYFSKWLKKSNIELKIPDFIWIAKKEIRLSFVAGLMDADGSARNKPVHVVTTIYEDYAKSIRKLLSSCGIQARFKKGKSVASRPSHWKILNMVTIINNRGKEELNKYTCVNIKISQKERETNSFTNEMIDFPYPNNIPWSRLCERNEYLYNIPVSVRNIEYNNEKFQTWDIEVENNNEFFCEGYLVHNSACISFGNLTDDRHRRLKTGEFWLQNPELFLSNNSVMYTEKPDIEAFTKEFRNLYKSRAGERGIVNQEALRKKAESCGREHEGQYLLNPCAETILRDSGGLCNLSEVIVRPKDTLEDLKEKVRIATIIGTLQSTLTNFKYIRKIWKDNAEEERLLGVSLTGQMDHKKLSDPTTAKNYLLEMKKIAKKTNDKYSDILGINRSKQLTLVKPSGTTSILCNTASGIHPRHSEYYIRRVTQDKKDPLTALMINEGVPYVVVGEKVIFSFPVKSPDESKINVTTKEQLELWLVYRLFWCDGNPSQTIYYNDDTFLELQDWIWKNWDQIGGLSFFPKDDNVYENQPFEEITENKYLELKSSFPKINWKNLKNFEKEDNSVLEIAAGCAGGSCEI